MKHFSKTSGLRLSLTVSVLAAAFYLMPANAASGRTAPVNGNSTTFQTAPTRFINVDGTRIAYRRFGKRGGIPLVFFQHFVGNLDGWDPKIIDGFARDRDVILFDNAGVGSSDGEVPTTIEAMAREGIAFIRALGVTRADLLGFSMGSLIAQEVAVEQPDLVRRVVLVGSGPRGGAGMATLTPEFQAVLAKKRTPQQDLLLDVFFTKSDASQAAGRAFLTRIHARKADRDAAISARVAPAQVAAFSAWGVPSEDSTAYLHAIKQPILVVSGSNDIVHYTINSYTLQQNLPDAQLIIYPDSNHGSLYQYPDLFLRDVTAFLNQPG
ncbi:alpha/beta hydrolase [Caballeronia sp. INDeC2]|uniref:alpha/beta fold hydrolase n=1 Tax=Caballeronia sp. INDeC2 TaxID=2921747 RepID=UPI002027E221|nr:alpha/beta hydrolase [Caballeronia sp. INDeC2]